jgi:hypothetical protein
VVLPEGRRPSAFRDLLDLLIAESCQLWPRPWIEIIARLAVTMQLASLISINAAGVISMEK